MFQTDLSSQDLSYRENLIEQPLSVDLHFHGSVEAFPMATLSGSVDTKK